MRWADGISILLILLAGSTYFAIAQIHNNSLSRYSQSAVIIVDNDTGDTLSLDSVMAVGDVGMIVAYEAEPSEQTQPVPSSSEPSVYTTPVQTSYEPSAQTPTVQKSPAGSQTPAPAAPCVNINTADEKQLVTLRGIGPATAAAIVAHRNQHGNFLRKEDIQKVRGIGPAKFAQVADHICL